MANLTEVCRELKNWFDRGQPKYTQRWQIEDGIIKNAIPRLRIGQYFRIMGSTFNDGVYQYPPYEDELRDEDFFGTIWLMAVPREIEVLSEEIEKWKAKYYDVEGQAMSPYSSESFAGYSYSKTGIYGSGDSSTGISWQNAFSKQLNRYRKI